MGFDQPEDATVIAQVASMNRGEARTQGSPSLVQYSGEALGKRYVLDKPKIVLGRSAHADISLAEASVSRLHAVIEIAGDGAFLSDHGSANGTFLNDKKIDSRVLVKDQDMIRLGALDLKFFSADNIDGIIHDKMYQEATRDVGTGIFNKRFLLDSIESEFAASQVRGDALSVIYYDLDFFKKVNDVYGHEAGDQILREQARVVEGVLGPTHIFCRFGGEEFVILLPKTANQAAVAQAEKIRQALENHRFSLKKDGQIVSHQQTLSLGVATTGKGSVNAKELLAIADEKLYHSKRSGRNRVTA